ncbi:MAG: cob(I)yrinic acid a,c-diamide adenosyltransferase [Thermoplasmataceae archaeon]|jgi:ATP:cob(I)alamin adenosyltransferase
MFTRRGDTGDTDTGDRERVIKSSPIIEVEGRIDELNSFIGLASTRCQWEDILADLKVVQEDLFTIGEEFTTKGTRRTLQPERLAWLENRTLELKKEAGRIRLFIVPGGSEIASLLHIVRTQSRNLERLVVSYKLILKPSPLLLQFLNRLSSLFFVQAVVANKRLGVEERIWEIRREI